VTIPDMPDARDHAGVAALDGRLYVSGGGWFAQRVIHDQLWAYDPATRSWSTLAPMPGPRAMHAMAGLAGELFVVGGVVAGGAHETGVWAYHPATDTWRTDVAPLAVARDHLVAVVSRERLYAIGGRHDGSLAVVEIYDPVTDTWERGRDMPTARGGHTAGVLGGVIHVTGGEDLGTGRTFGEHEGLDPDTRSWAGYAGLPTPRHGLASGVVGDAWYVLGGGRSAGLSTTSTVEVWRP
jgi:N-acetylneuraminic acid mutarotase